MCRVTLSALLLFMRKAPNGVEPASVCENKPTTPRHGQRAFKAFDSNSCRDRQLGTAKRLPRLSTLDQGGLALQDLQGLFESGDLCIPALLASCVTLRLHDALALNLSQILLHSVQLILHPGAIGAQLGGGLVQLLRFLRLVFDILNLGCPLDLVLLAHLFMLGDSCLLVSSDLGKVLGEIFLYSFQKTDNTRCRALGGPMSLAALSVVLPQDLQRSLQPDEACIKLSLARLERSLLLSTKLVQLRLGHR